MSFVDRYTEVLREQGIYSADPVHKDVIGKIVNMEEWEYMDIELGVLESYLGILAQEIKFIKEKSGIANAKVIELGNSFKREAIPLVVSAKIRSVEERWLHASTLNDDLKAKFEEWQQAVLMTVMLDNQENPLIDKLNVLKKIYDDRRPNGNSAHLHKYSNG